MSESIKKTETQTTKLLIPLTFAARLVKSTAACGHRQFNILLPIMGTKEYMLVGGNYCEAKARAGSIEEYEHFEIEPSADTDKEFVFPEYVDLVKYAIKPKTNVQPIT